MNLQRFRVPLGFLFAVFFLYFSRPRPAWFWPGICIAATGLAIRIRAAGYLEKWKRLATSGPYSRTRNPLYFGSFVLGLGLTAASARPSLIALFLGLFLSVYLPVMRREEGELRQAYGEDFERYSRSVPLFIPRLRARGTAADLESSSRGSGFDWGRVIRNREYKAVLGFLLISCFLWLKMSWL